MGAGRAVLDAAGAAVGSEATLTFRYTAPPSGVPSGGSVALRLPAGGMKPAERGEPVVSAPRPHALTLDPIAGPFWMKEPITWRYVVSLPDGLGPDETLVLRLDVRLPLYAALTPAEAFLALGSIRLRDPLYRCDVAWPGMEESVRAHLPLAPGAPAQLIALAPSATTADRPVRVRVRWEDGFDNWLPESPVEGSALVEGPGPGGDTIRRLAEPVCAGAWGVDWPGLPSGIHRLRVRWGEWETRTNPIAVGLLPSPLYFGDLHFHSGYSGDGIGHPTLALESARDRYGLDFAALSDHDPKPEAWNAVAGYVEAAHEPDVFAALHGFEHSRHGKEWGHRNVIFRGPHPGTPKASESLPWELARDYAAGDFLAIPHHFNTTNRTDGGTGAENPSVGLAWQHVDWTRELPEQVPVLEIVQIRGSFETDERDAEWGVVRAGRGASARDALRAGWKLGFLGSSDNHFSRPGQPMPGRPNISGVAAVFAPRLDRAPIFDAIKSRRCYATTGDRILLWVTLNDAPMGSDLPFAPDRRLHVLAAGTESITDLQVVQDGEVVARWEGGQDDLTWEWTDPAPRADRPSYYYVRLRQTNGQIAWSSPIYVAARETRPGGTR